MRNVHIPGGQQDVGASQGYAGISVEYKREPHPFEEGKFVTAARIVYAPDADERMRLNQGAPIVLTLLIGNGAIQPHRIEIGSA